MARYSSRWRFSSSYPNSGLRTVEWMDCLRTFRCPTLVSAATFQQLELCPDLSQHVRWCARLDAVYLVGISVHVVKLVFAMRVIDVFVARSPDRDVCGHGHYQL